MNTLQEKQLQKDNYSLYYYTQGDPARELIVFIHPAFGDHTCFHQQMDAFAENYHVISLDMLGHGKSQVNGAKITIEKTADLVAEIIEAEGHRDAHLVGVSLGSLMAQHIAAKHPTKVRSVTVTGGYSIFGDNAAIAKVQAGEKFKWLFLALFSMEKFRRYVAKVTNYVEAEREIFYQATLRFTRRSFRVMAGIQKIMDKRPKSLSQPLLIVAGERDLPIVYANSLAWHQQEPNSRLALIRAAGHCANMDNAREFNRVLGEFLAQLA